MAECCGIAVPFNAAITSATAFHHKAGLHTNAVLRDPSTYEIFDPSRFGRARTIMAGHRLTGLATARGGAALDMTYVVRTRSPEESLALVTELSRLEGVQGVELKEG